jgi:ribonuclease E
MVKRMLVDTNHPEETRVVVIDGTRLEAFDLETSTKKQNKGNIYLAKIIRVEPSLQAAFVDYGGNRHGFLAFSEIHPDYYQIPVADREALIAEAKAHDDALNDDEDSENLSNEPELIEVISEKTEAIDTEAIDSDAAGTEQTIPIDVGNSEDTASKLGIEQSAADSANLLHEAEILQEDEPASNDEDSFNSELSVAESDNREDQTDKETDGSEHQSSTKPGVEEVGGDDETEESLDAHRRKFVASRRYKIQEVIKRKQILLVQVVKEERGNKGAALTTYLSLAGRYCVLMPNSARGGGVSRKITNAKDRRRLKSIVSDLKIPEHMAVILRTAGAERSKAEVKRDYEYLQRTWNHIREVTMESRAPALIHEEANLIKRSIRDVYSKDIEEILVEGEEGYKAAKEFMKTLTPSHAKKVQRYKDDTIPLFHRYQVESQLDAMHSATTQLKSGGSIVFGQTEALVAIDVNSGKATKERHIEETALKTNLEAADEIARQLRLRDLAGLVVIDFIDMDESRNNHAVERRLKEALKIDRARIQVGRISHFGLLELSRQRLRPSLIETNFETCKSCAGSGLIRSIESTSIKTLRAIEEEGLRHRTTELTVFVHPDVALYILNYKRVGLEEIQKRQDMNVLILGDISLIPPDLRMERVKGEIQKKHEEPKLIETVSQAESTDPEEDRDDSEPDDGRKRRRRRRKRKRPEGDDNTNLVNDNDEKESNSEPDEKDQAASRNLSSPGHEQPGDGDTDEDAQSKSRRRGRRGGRRRRKHGDDNSTQENAPSNAQLTEDTSNSFAVRDPISSGLTDLVVEEISRDLPATGAPAKDAIPLQSIPEPTAKTASRFLDVFKKGAEAIRSSVSDASETKTRAPKSMSTTAANESSSQQTSPNEVPKPQSPLENAAVEQTEAPSSPPRKGWWNNDA